MPLPFASQDLDLRFIAIFSSAILEILGLFAGAVLLIVERMVVDFDVDVPRLFEIMSTLGIAPIALAWCIYMTALGVVFGYKRTENSDLILFLILLFAAAYYCCVLIASALPFIHYPPSVM